MDPLNSKHCKLRHISPITVNYYIIGKPSSANNINNDTIEPPPIRKHYKLQHNMDPLNSKHCKLRHISPITVNHYIIGKPSSANNVNNDTIEPPLSANTINYNIIRTP